MDISNCKNCQCEIPKKIATKYNGYCKNCYKLYKSSSNKFKKKTILCIILIIILIVFGIIYYFNEIKIKEHLLEEFTNKLEENISNIYDTEKATEYGLTKINYSIQNISKVQDHYEIEINLNCIANEELTETEKSLLAYAVEDVVPEEFKDNDGNKIISRNSKGGYYQMINTKINGNLIHSSNSNNSNITNDEKGNAVAIAQTEIKSKLKSPSSAKFPASFDEYQIKKDGNTFTVNSYVEADNSFGANLKTEYSIKFTIIDEEKYIVNNITIYD